MEEKARAKERFFSRDDFGQWIQATRPELWNPFNGKKRMGSTRVFPIQIGPRWTFGNIYFCILLFLNCTLPRTTSFGATDHGFLLVSTLPRDGDEPQMKMVRFRTLGDITITGGQEKMPTP